MQSNQRLAATPYDRALLLQGGGGRPTTLKGAWKEAEAVREAVFLINSFETVSQKGDDHTTWSYACEASARDRRSTLSVVTPVTSPTPSMITAASTPAAIGPPPSSGSKLTPRRSMSDPQLLMLNDEGISTSPRHTPSSSSARSATRTLGVLGEEEAADVPNEGGRGNDDVSRSQVNHDGDGRDGHSGSSGARADDSVRSRTTTANDDSGGPPRRRESKSRSPRIFRRKVAVSVSGSDAATGSTGAAGIQIHRRHSEPVEPSLQPMVSSRLGRATAPDASSLAPTAGKAMAMMSAEPSTQMPPYDAAVAVDATALSAPGAAQGGPSSPRDATVVGSSKMDEVKVTVTEDVESADAKVAAPATGYLDAAGALRDDGSAHTHPVMPTISMATTSPDDEDVAPLAVAPQLQFGEDVDA